MNIQFISFQFVRGQLAGIQNLNCSHMGTRGRALLPYIRRWWGLHPKTCPCLGAETKQPHQMYKCPKTRSPIICHSTRASLLCSTFNSRDPLRPSLATALTELTHTKTHVRHWFTHTHLTNKQHLSAVGQGRSHASTCTSPIALSSWGAPWNIYDRYYCNASITYFIHSVLFISCTTELHCSSSKINVASFRFQKEQSFGGKENDVAVVTFVSHNHYAADYIKSLFVSGRRNTRRDYIYLSKCHPWKRFEISKRRQQKNVQ